MLGARPDGVLATSAEVRPAGRGPVLGPLGRRLAAAFVLVVALALGLVALLATHAVRAQTSGLDDAHRARAEREIVRTLAAAYAEAGSWQGADLSPARAVAQAAGLQVVILNAAGGSVATVTPTEVEPDSTAPGLPATRPPRGPGRRASATSAPTSGSPSPGDAGQRQQGQGVTSGPAGSQTEDHGGSRTGVSSDPGRQRGQGAGAGRGAGAAALRPPAPPVVRSPVPITSSGTPIAVAGQVVGHAVIEASPKLVAPAVRASDAILTTLFAAAVAALALATLAAVFVSRQITHPLMALAAAAAAVERGDPDAARLLIVGPGELGIVARSFARMEATLRREDELRRALTADVAHELRTPVTILRGGTEAMLDGIEPLSEDRVLSLHEEVLRLERLVDDLATLSAAEAAGLRLERRPVDLCAVATLAVEQLRPRFAESGQRADVTTPSEPTLVLGDRMRLGQVVTNLLTNAQAFSPRGGEIRVVVDREGTDWRLRVIDDGPGIAENDLPHVFRRFFRGQGSQQRNGTGIGLAVVAELVAAHEGTVEAASPPTGGAVLTVRLPVA